MVSVILLPPQDIAAVYVSDRERNLGKWLGTSAAVKIRKPCDYFDEQTGKRQIDDSVRTCFKYTNVDVAFKNNNGLMDQIAESFSNFKTIRLSNPELLEYTVGGFFDEHTDTKRTKNHAGNALLIPPLDMVGYTGGTLLVDRRRISAHPSKWKLVVLPLGTEHRVTKVLSGTRAVIKFEIRGVQALKVAKKPAKPSGPATVASRHRNRNFTGGRKD